MIVNDQKYNFELRNNFKMHLKTKKWYHKKTGNVCSVSEAKMRRSPRASSSPGDFSENLILEEMKN